VSNALPYNPVAPSTFRPPPAPSGVRPLPADMRPRTGFLAPLRVVPGTPFELPKPPHPVPATTPERMLVAKGRIQQAAETGLRLRSYEVALDLDMSEFHFARQFRASFGRSPHRYYDEVRCEKARAMLGEGVAESDVARRIGLRRPAELRALLSKCSEPA
jgi:AraC-like DNA-binding protein